MKEINELIEKQKNKDREIDKIYKEVKKEVSSKKALELFHQKKQKREKQ